MNNKRQFNPGPWKLIKSGDCLGINDPQGDFIISDLFYDKDQELANFTLMSRAPEMFEALEVAFQFLKVVKVADGYPTRKKQEIIEMLECEISNALLVEDEDAS